MPDLKYFLGRVPSDDAPWYSLVEIMHRLKPLRIALHEAFLWLSQQNRCPRCSERAYDLPIRPTCYICFGQGIVPKFHRDFLLIADYAEVEAFQLRKVRRTELQQHSACEDELSSVPVGFSPITKKAYETVTKMHIEWLNAINTKISFFDLLSHTAHFCMQESFRLRVMLKRKNQLKRKFRILSDEHQEVIRNAKNDLAHLEYSLFDPEVLQKLMHDFPEIKVSEYLERKIREASRQLEEFEQSFLHQKKN